MKSKRVNFHVIINLITCVLFCAAVAAEIPKAAISGLGSERFEDREQAYAVLKKWSFENIKTAPESLHKIWLASESPEVKARCYTLMKQILIRRKFGKGEGFLGIVMDSVMIPAKGENLTRHAVGILKVEPKTPAEKFGLRIGDTILQVDDYDLNNARMKLRNPKNDQFGSDPIVVMLSNYIRAKEPDEVITLHILRRGKRIAKKVTLMKRGTLGIYSEDKIAERADRFFKDWLMKMGQ